jgi:hypothetical protein
VCEAESLEDAVDDWSDGRNAADDDDDPCLGRGPDQEARERVYFGISWNGSFFYISFWRETLLTGNVCRLGQGLELVGLHGRTGCGAVWESEGKWSIFFKCPTARGTGFTYVHPSPMSVHKASLSRSCIWSFQKRWIGYNASNASLNELKPETWQRRLHVSRQTKHQADGERKTMADNTHSLGRRNSSGSPADPGRRSPGSSHSTAWPQAYTGRGWCQRR